MTIFEFSEKAARITQMILRKELTPEEGAAMIRALETEECCIVSNHCVTHGNAAGSCKEARA